MMRKKAVAIALLPLMALALLSQCISKGLNAALPIGAPGGFALAQAEEEAPAKETPGEALAAEAAEETKEGTDEAPPAEDGTTADEDLPADFAKLSPHEAVVRNYAELKSALADNNGITTVYFGDNITIQSTGVRIHPNKANVIVDGFNPLDPEQTKPYTLTDYESSIFTNTIYINAAGVKSLLVRNLTIIGKNYYGSFSVSDSSALADVVITYERVNYNGPQMVYHRQGTTRIVGCTVRIHGNNGGSVSSEFSEAKHLVFEGSNTIDTVTSTLTVFWHPAGGTFTVANNASLVLTSPNTSSTYGVFYADGSAYKVDVTIGRHAVFDATISGTVAPSSNVTLSSLILHESGTFHLKTTKSANAHLLIVNGPLTVEKDAKFIINGYGGASYAALRQEGGDILVGEDATFHIVAHNAYAYLLNLYGRSLICNNPGSVLLYNANRNIRAQSSPGRVYVNAQQINYWDSLSAGGLDEPALYRWEKADKSNVVIDGTIATGDSGDITSLTSNYTSGAAPPSAATFSMVRARVLAFGRLALLVAEPAKGSKAVSGVTAPSAAVRLTFTQEGENYTFAGVAADAAGVFQIPLSVQLKEGTVVKVQSNWQYLTATAEKSVSSGGILALSVPDSMEFTGTELTAFPQTVERLSPDWKIVVSDTRQSGNGWRMYARLNSELTPSAQNRPALVGAVIFVDASGQKTVMNQDADIMIAQHTATDDKTVFSVVWEHDKGILLSITPGTGFAGTVYTAVISWTLLDTP